MNKFLKELYFKYQILLKPILLSLASIIVLSLVIIPQLLSYLDVGNNINSLQNKIGIYEAKAQELDKIDPDLALKSLQTVFLALPKDKEIPQGFLVLQSLISQSGLALDSTKLVDSTTNSGSFRISISVTGTLESLRSLLINLQNSPRVLRIDGIEAQSLKRGLEMQATIILTMFYDSTQVSTAPDQPLAQLDQKDQTLLDGLKRSISKLGDLGAPSATRSAVPLGKSDPFE